MEKSLSSDVASSSSFTIVTKSRRKRDGNLVHVRMHRDSKVGRRSRGRVLLGGQPGGGIRDRERERGSRRMRKAYTRTATASSRSRSLLLP